MQTRLPNRLLATPTGAEANRILRSCVHCGFCTATCPTYQLLGDERDGPRGRIYLIKQALEGAGIGRHTLAHLDRCLTCRACETTCPSGVDYGHLLDIGREQVERQVGRPLWQRVQRALLRAILPDARRFGRLLGLAQRLRPWLPARLKRRIPAQVNAGPWPERRHPRRLLLPGGCVQPALDPGIDAAAARVLDGLGIQLIRSGGCCGAVHHHLSASAAAREQARRNIDAWWPHLEAGAEGILSTASGCGVMLKDYGHLLREDPDYADKAAKIAELTRDLVEVLETETLPAPPGRTAEPIVFHPPCTLQHGQRLAGRVEALLQRAGFTLLPLRDAHLCCGSAGTYSLTQPDLSHRLRDNKLAALTEHQPARIVTANIGCQMHLAGESPVPVQHWIQLFDPTGPHPSPATETL